MTCTEQHSTNNKNHLKYGVDSSALFFQVQHDRIYVVAGYSVRGSGQRAGYNLSNRRMLKISPSAVHMHKFRGRRNEAAAVPATVLTFNKHEWGLKMAANSGHPIPLGALLLSHPSLSKSNKTIILDLNLALCQSFTDLHWRRLTTILSCSRLSDTSVPILANHGAG